MCCGECSPEDLLPFLQPTGIVDSDHPRVRDLAQRTVAGITDPVERAVRLYLAVRDGIRYDPYVAFNLPEHYRASLVIERGRSFCIPKASLLCALARACGIPARLGFADVKNHLATRQLIEFLGTDVFVYHAYTEMHLEGKWVKATPAFNRELCERHNVPPLEFDGLEDSMFQPFNRDRKKYMEYTRFHDTYADVPVEKILSAWEDVYGKERVAKWNRLHGQKGEESLADFDREEVWKP